MVGVDEISPHNIRKNYFLKGYNYNVEYNILYQDNKNTILMQDHGQVYSRNHAKHINAI